MGQINDLSLFDQIIEAVPDEYFNTTNLSGPVLKEAKMKAGSQNFEILDLFKKYSSWKLWNFTPFEIQKHFNYVWPLTSIRRALTTLTKAGYLVRTDIKRTGCYGRETYTWRFK